MARASLSTRRFSLLATCSALVAACGDGGDVQSTSVSPPPAVTNPRSASPTPTNAPPTIAGTPQTSAIRGVPYHFAPYASDANNDPLTFTVAHLPHWAVFSTSTGELDGVPPTGTFEDIVIGVSDGQDRASLAPFTIRVADTAKPNSPPSVTGSPPTTVAAGQRYSFVPGASDTDGDPLTFAVSNPPAWASFSPGTGELTGTPSAADVGTFADVVIRVSDGVNEGSLPPFKITVASATASNAPPAISGSPPTTVTVGQIYSFTPTASDPDGNPLTFVAANLPPWAHFNVAIGRIDGTPTASQVGAYDNVTISVSDGRTSASLAAFKIVVTPAASSNSLPTIAGSPSATVTTDQAYAFTPTAADIDGDSLTFTADNLPGWAAFDTSTGRISGTPSPANVGTYSNIEIRVSDGNANASLAPFSITVRLGNRAPVITGNPATFTTQGQAYSFTPSGSDADGDSLAFSISNKPSWATFDIATGWLAGTPSPANVGSYGNIIVAVSDGQASASLAAFTITVQAANRPPVISGTPATTVAPGQSYSFAPIASDPDGNTLTFGISARPSWATFNANTGQLNGTPAAANVGTYGGITITVSDGQASATLAAFSINVPSVNRAPAISGNAPTSVTQGQAYSFEPTASDPDGNSLTFSITNRPSWATFNTTTGRLEGTASGAGTFSGITISVTDGQASASLAAFAITVHSSNRAPVISGTPTATVLAGQSYSFVPTGSDPDGDPLTFAVSNLPSWAAFSTSTGRVSGTPTSAHVGTYNDIVVSASDGRTTSSLQSFAITVTAVTNGSSTLSWTPPTHNTDGSTLQNLAGYRIYWGTSQSSLSNSITVNNSGLSSFVVEQLSPATWYFAVSALNAQGVESSRSNVASKTIP